MRDFQDEVYDALAAVCPRVYFSYPNDFTVTPLISFSDLDNSSETGDDLLTHIAYSVDVWAKTVIDCKSAAEAVDGAMRGLGLRRSFSQALTDPSGLRRQSMRYEGTYNALDGKIYSRS